MRGWSYNVLYVYRRTTNDNDDDDDENYNVVLQSCWDSERDVILAAV